MPARQSPPTDSDVTYRVGQIFGTTASTNQVAFLAALESSPHHLSFDDLAQYQEFTLTDTRDQIARPCVIAEVPTAPGLIPKVYLLATFKGKALTDVSPHMAHWAVKVQRRGVQNPASEEVIHTTPEWEREGTQWIMAYAIRPTKPLTAWGSEIVVEPSEMQRLRHISEQKMVSWARQLQMSTTRWARTRGGPSLSLARLSLTPPVSPVRPAGHPVATANNLSPSSPAGESQDGGHRYLPEKYFEALDDLLYAPWEMAFINAQLDFHRDHKLALLANTNTLEPRDRPLIDLLLRWHTQSNDKLRMRAAIAVMRTEDSRFYEEQRWVYACGDPAPHSALNLYCRPGGRYSIVRPPQPPNTNQTLSLPAVLPAPGHMPVDADSDAESIDVDVVPLDTDSDNGRMDVDEYHPNTSPLLKNRAAPREIDDHSEFEPWLFDRLTALSSQRGAQRAGGDTPQDELRVRRYKNMLRTRANSPALTERPRTETPKWPVRDRRGRPELKLPTRSRTVIGIAPENV